jgi:hypothetical protein
MDGKTKIKLALAAFTLYTAVWILFALNGALYIPWFSLLSQVNLTLIPSIILGSVWAYAIREFWQIRAVFKAALILIAAYSVFWLVIMTPGSWFLGGNDDRLQIWANANFLWVPLINALTFTALGIYRIVKRPKKKPAPYLFG